MSEEIPFDPTTPSKSTEATQRIRSPKTSYDEVFVMGKIKQLVEPLDNEQLKAVTAWYLSRYGSV